MKKTLLLLALLGAGVLPFTGCRTVPTPLVVATYNVRCPGDQSPNTWRERRGDVVKQLRRIDPDVFGLQEALADYSDYLLAEMPDYAMEGGCRDDGKRRGEASPVFYRKDRFTCLKKGTFWLSETPDVPGRKGWGAACPRVCSWVLLSDRATGRPFVFCNTHTDHVSALARENGMLLIIARMKEFCPPGTPIVFTGDHNCLETEAPARAVARLLDNALYTTATPPEGCWRTWNGWRWRDREVPTTEGLACPPETRNTRPGSPDARKECAATGPSFYEKCGGPRIDYIYVSPGTRVDSYKTWSTPRPGLQTYPSDHFPISARLVF